MFRLPPSDRRKKKGEPLTLQEIGYLLEGMPKDDRSAVVVSVSVIDNALQTLLADHFVADKALREWAFESSSALGSFSAKIGMCRLLDLIGPETHRNLEYVRKVRNLFAHEVLLPGPQNTPDHVTFESPQIADLCKNLACDWPAGIAQTGRERYLFLCAHVFVLVHTLRDDYREAPITKPYLP